MRGVRSRKRIEESDLRRTRFRGIARTQQRGYFIGAALNLLRIAKMTPIAG